MRAGLGLEYTVMDVKFVRSIGRWAWRAGFVGGIMMAVESGKKKRQRIVLEILSYTRTIVFSMLFVYLICTKVVTHASVPTGSMESTIMTGSHVVVNRLAYLSEEPQRGDIITFDYPDDESKSFLKRIIGLPGEVIMGADGKVYIDGVMLEEPYVNAPLNEDFGPYCIPAGCYFVMGDNRNNSLDSRFWRNKFVKREAITGKVQVELYPELKLLD